MYPKNSDISNASELQLVIRVINELRSMAAMPLYGPETAWLGWSFNWFN